MPVVDLAIIATSVSAIALFFIAFLWMRGRQERRDKERLSLAVAENQTTPPSLHPVIDPNICIGSLSCIRACPEGDIIGLVDGRAELIEGSHCIGHSKCALDCPVGAIQLVFGTHQKGMDLPETDEFFESSRPGVYVIGELGGMGLIKNAIRQGLDVVEAIKRKGVRAAEADAVDVAIVGGGPSGIACAVACKAAGLSFRLLEQDTLGGTVAHFPRNKVVMTEQVVVPFYGKFGRSILSKEELLAEFQTLVEKAEVRIDEGARVEGLDGAAGRFTVKTTRGPVKAGAVVLATGLRGTPRKIGCPGEDSPKVTYRLIDPGQYHGKRVLVVGGGDSAVEAAIQLATESSAKVSISYRQDSFSRAKPRNRELIADLIAQKRVRAIMSSQVNEVHPDRVVLTTSDGQKGQLKNDNIIVCIGGELPTKFLEKMGVSIRRYHAEAKGASVADVARRSKGGRRLAWTLTILGVAIVLGLFWVGRSYYVLDDDSRAEHVLHEFLKPAGLWGHGVGVIATVFMMANFLYALRKRWRRLKGKASIHTWLMFHVFVGLMSPIVIAFHAAFQAKNLLAAGTWSSLAIVVGTGAFGRFLFAFVPAADGKLVALKELEARFKKHREHLAPFLDEVTNAFAVQQVLDEVVAAPPPMSFLRMLVHGPRRAARARWALKKVQIFFPEPESFHVFRADLLAASKLRMQIAFYGRIKRLFRVWLALHITVAVFMVFLIAAHVAVSLFLGYRWMFS